MLDDDFEELTPVFQPGHNYQGMHKVENYFSSKSIAREKSNATLVSLDFFYHHTTKRCLSSLMFPT